jgi:hypothetical protein
MSREDCQKGQMVYYKVLQVNNVQTKLLFTYNNTWIICVDLI